MRHIALPEKVTRRLVWYLAMEEYIAGNLDVLCEESPTGGREAFFLWQVEPTVIFGRNQVMEAEVNTDYCRSHGINYFRRKSGGGCVYADMGNIMLSYISSGTDARFTFHRFLSLLELALRRLGVDARVSGRNDIMIGGRKVSGNAFTLLPKSSIVHGTLLYDVDFDALENAITPSSGKIQSKGVASVRNHVTNLRQELEGAGRPLSVEVLKAELIRFFCGGPDGIIDSVTLSPSDIAAIDLLEQDYLRPEFLNGRRHGFNLIREGRIDGVGEIKLSFAMEGDAISSVALEGDFFQTGEDASKVLSAALKGLPMEREAIGEALNHIDLGIVGLNPQKLLEIIFNNQ